MLPFYVDKACKCFVYRELRRYFILNFIYAKIDPIRSTGGGLRSDPREGMSGTFNLKFLNSSCARRRC